MLWTVVRGALGGLTLGMYTQYHNEQVMLLNNANLKLMIHDKLEEQCKAFDERLQRIYAREEELDRKFIRTLTNNS